MRNSNISRRRGRVLALSSLLLLTAVLAISVSLEGVAPPPSPAFSGVRPALPLATTCPVCGQRSVFAPYGNPHRARAMCTVCGSLERHRLLNFYLKEKTNLYTDRLSVLHFSPEKGLSAVLKAQKNLTYATSWYETDRPADYHLDLTALALPDESWDVLIVYHILEHITDDRTAMREMYRVLKPGGWAVVQVPVLEQPGSIEDPSADTPEERTAKFGRFDHVRHYGWQDFTDRLTAAGFEVTTERFGRELSDEQVRKFGLDRDERIYLLRKPATGRM